MGLDSSSYDTQATSQASEFNGPAAVTFCSDDDFEAWTLDDFPASTGSNQFFD
jgi:hypothetical protein